MDNSVPDMPLVEYIMRHGKPGPYPLGECIRFKTPHGTVYVVLDEAAGRWTRRSGGASSRVVFTLSEMLLLGVKYREEPPDPEMIRGWIEIKGAFPGARITE